MKGDASNSGPWLLPNAAWHSADPKAASVHITAPRSHWPRGRAGIAAYCGQSAWLSMSGPKVMVELGGSAPEGLSWCETCVREHARATA